MKALLKFANVNDPNSFGAACRRKVFAFFEQLIEGMPKPVTILDVGGTQRFWEAADFVNKPGYHITLLNKKKPEVEYDNFTGISGDAINLSDMEDNTFDIVFSNSVIEHVGKIDKQKMMAQEIQRVGKKYFVQTPNFWFPIEPHFLFPAFHWLPVSARAYLLTMLDLGWAKKQPNMDAARQSVERISLMTKRELLNVFPGANIYSERLFGLTKSFIAYKWDK